MERAFITARAKNKHTRRVFKVVGVGIIMCVLIALSFISSYNSRRAAEENTFVDYKIADYLTNQKITSSNYDPSDYPSSLCEDGFPDFLKTTEEKCEFVKQACPSDRLIDYLHFRYCVLGDKFVAVFFGMALIIFWLMVLFYMLSQAAESHFCPMLSEISSALRMSPDLAGMSILAFGNGAPDVFSSIAAFQHNNVGVLIGEMLGAGAFITHVIVGAIGVTNPVTLRTYPFIRDLACYLLGLAFVLALLIDGSLHIWEAFGFLAFYFIYLGVAIVIHVVEVKKGKAAVVTKGKQHQHHDKNGDMTAPLLINSEFVNDSGEATLVEPDDDSTRGPARRRRAMSVHVSEVPVLDAPEYTTPAGPTTSTTLAPGRSFERGGASERGRSASPGLKIKDAEAAELRKTFQQMKEAEEEDARLSEEEVPELVLPSTEYSVQGSDQVKVVVHEHKEENKHPVTDRNVKELKGLSELRSIASSAAQVFLPKPGVELRRRYDDIDILHERQRHLFRNGILNVVQDWKEGGELVLPTTDVPAASGADSDKPDDGDSAALMDRKTSLWQRFKDYIQWNDMGKVGRVLYIIMLPVSLIMHITVPHPEDEAYNKWLLAVATALSPIPIFWALDLYEGDGWIALCACLGASTIIAILICIFAKPKGLPRWLQFVFIFWGFVTSMMWIYYTADEIVSLLQALSQIFGLSSTIMGLTLLAWGNCIGDFVADITVSNQGYPEMGIAATYGGPLFNLLIGMGLGGTIAAMEEHKVPTPLGDMMLIDFIYLLIALAASLVIIPIRKFRVDKIIGAILLVGYIIFLTLSILVECNVLHLLSHGSSSADE